MMGLVALIASSEQQLKPAAASGARLYFAGFATEMHVKHIQGAFLTAPPDFQYQNENQVLANQDYFFKKFSM